MKIKQINSSLDFDCDLCGRNAYRSNAIEFTHQRSPKFVCDSCIKEIQRYELKERK